MARVFVSHASEDRALAGEVHRWLAEAGHEVFLDQDLRDGVPPGEEWEQRLHERLRWANAVVCVVTSAYLDSTWCAAEVGIARSRGSQLLPLRAEPGVAHPLLTSVQHTDYTTDPSVARAAVIKALRQVDTTWPDDRSPFPGLRPFDTDQHRVFFGRADEVGHLAELLRSAAERAEGAALLVVGPSGCGKSSLIRAGLLPAMAGRPGWRTLPPILPGTDPVAALVRELAAAARRSTLDWTADHVHQQLDQRGLTGLADELLLADSAGPQQRLLIVVDQFEELLTQTAPADRARFTELLRPALTGPVRVVATLRPEFLDQLLVDPDLAALPTRTYTLRPLRREALRAVIERPARLAGIDVDDALVARLVDDTDTGEALPLLAFTLAQLAEGITRGGRLSSARYDQLGGVQGALTRQADAALADAVTASGRSREQVIAGLLRLVTVDEQGRPTRWRVLRDELPTPVITELAAFVARRLLITDEGNGSGIVGVTHEAFLSAWPPLAQAITAAASALRARRAVEHAATEWHDNDRPPARLWGGGQLAAAVTDTGASIRAGTASSARQGRSWWLPQRHRVLITDRVDLSPKARDFLHASIRLDRYRRRRVTTVLSVLLILALVAAGVAVVQQRLAQERQRIATAHDLVAQADVARDNDPRTALQLGIAAERIHPDAQARASLVNTLTATPYAGTLTGHTDDVNAVAFSPDGTTVATASFDDTVILWDVTNPTRPRSLGQPLTGHKDQVSSARFSPDGHTLATGSTDDTAILWNVTDPDRPQQLGPPLTNHKNNVTSVAFSPDGHTLATASADRTVILWNVTDPARPQPIGSPLAGHIGSVISVAFSPDGKTLATASFDSSSILWDLTDPAQPRPLHPPLTGHSGSVTSVAFSPDGKTLATASTDGTAILWDLTYLALPRPLTSRLTGHGGGVSSVAFSPDGHTLASASADRTVILWDLTNPARLHRLDQPLTGHSDLVLSVAFSPNGRTLAAANYDGTVTLWDLTERALPRQLGQRLAGHSDTVILYSFPLTGAPWPPPALTAP
ncbi:MAG: TIR domain-containing protein [Pseudonocardiaceae bacterium]